MSDGNSDLNWVFEIFPNEIAVLTVPFCMVSDFKVTNSSLICRWISDNWHRSGYECVFWRHIRVFFSFLCSSLNVPIWGPKLSIWKVKSPSPGVGLGGKAVRGLSPSSQGKASGPFRCCVVWLGGCLLWLSLMWILDSQHPNFWLFGTVSALSPTPLTIPMKLQIIICKPAKPPFFFCFSFLPPTGQKRPPCGPYITACMTAVGPYWLWRP